MAAPPIAERHLHHFHRRSPIKESVRVATTANITLSGTQTIDGIAVIAEDRVLVKDQSSASGDGLYRCQSGAWVRDYDVSTDDPAFGYLVFVREGSTNGGTLWKNTNTSAPTLGSTSLTFAQFGSGASFATPAIVLGTAAAAGVASTTIRSDATILAFDVTAPANIAGSPSVGTATVAARRDHVHALTYHSESLTDGASNFIFAGGDIVTVVGVPN